ncbi:universal stress protein [Halorubrum ejinorense]|uniref:Universal stress protein n=1 Tax=Halorubrum ejinorense TaxID=425309 RepID=A0AAV3SUK5_9EURY
MEHPNVLVFVEFPDPTVPTTGFLNHLKYPDAEVVGFYHLDDDESAEEVRAARGAEFASELEAIAERFEQVGVRTDHDLVFDRDRFAARQQIVEQEDVDAVLLPGAANTLGKVLIASRDLRNAERKVPLLDIVDQTDLISIGLVHVADPDDPDGEAEGARILKETASTLTDAGFPELKIDRTVRTGTDVAFELGQAASGYDLIVLGETEQDIGDRIFGPVGEYIVDERQIPVLILR